MNNRYLRARTLARSRHVGQRYGENPYSYHLDRVAELATPFGSEAMIVAQLHDLLEDTNTSVDEIAAEFGFTIADAVLYLTDNASKPREERTHSTYDRLRSLNIYEEPARLALIVKACDRLANVRASRYLSAKHYHRYVDEHRHFKLACYRQGLCEAVWWELDNLISKGE
ncbi:HD domain-containing protein [Thaumasiovibrio sp. DFM-14]|uniref:HD domain-containing protein n=1 Tax=Thaumasiovibrio sp. DFM-14 TaxID=3384792 RepID=UPI0039A2940A